MKNRSFKPARFLAKRWVLCENNDRQDNVRHSRHKTITKTITTICVTLFAMTTSGQNIPKLFKKSLPAIVKVGVLHLDGTSSEGTGFFIDGHTIVTCHHVMDNANTISVQGSNGSKYTPDKVVASDKATDLIKFTVKEKSSVWLKLSAKLPETGENVFVIGNPEDYDFSVTSGIVSAIRKRKGVQVIQNTAPCAPGSSGSPVMNKKGQVVGVMSYIKFAGQNLNFAATSLQVVNMKHDNTIKTLTPVAAMMGSWEIDSIHHAAKHYMQAREYQKALNTILPITKFANDKQSIEFIEIIASCHFFLQDYPKASKYHEHLVKLLHDTKPHTPDQVFTYAQTLQKQSMCYFMLGDKSSAVECIAQAADVCKTGLQMDTLRKEIYTVLIQQVYASDAMYKVALNKKFEACISWKLAKEYGYKEDDYGFDAICKDND